MPRERSGREWSRVIHSRIDRASATDIITFNTAEFDEELEVNAFLRQIVEILGILSAAELMEAAEKIDPAFSRVRRSKSLDAYYVPNRYPNGLPGGVPSRFYDDPGEAEEAGRLAAQVIEAVKGAFPGGA